VAVFQINWLCHSPSPYNADLFRCLAQQPWLDLTVHYHATSTGSHPWAADLTQGYQARSCQTRWGIDWSVIRLALRQMGRSQSHLFVIAGWAEPTAMLLLLLLSLGLGRYVLWTDTPNLGRSRSPGLAFLRNLWLRWILGRADRVMGTGEPAVRMLHRMGAAAKRLVVFPYWIDLADYQRPCSAGRSLANSVFRLVSIGRIINDLKGHHLILQAIAKLKVEQNLLAEYQIIGAGEDEAVIRQMAIDLGIQDQVQLLGWLEKAEIIRCLTAADAFIHPSPVHEPYGVVVLEAMACGKPVLASDLTFAARDRVEPGVNGLIHPAGDVAAIAADIAQLLQAPQRAIEMGQKARETANQWPLERAINIIHGIAFSA
jgi:glycosyltransferase involved in cell wall biosynthesis